MRSTVANDNCVEVAGLLNSVSVRDSKDPDGPKLVVSRRDLGRLAALLKGL